MFSVDGQMVIEEFLQVSAQKDTAVSIGVFDGVHLGHQSLLLKTKEEAMSRRLLSAVITFRNHPRTVLTPGFKPRYLMGVERRLEVIKALGVDLVVAISFTPAVASLRAREFVSLLRDRLKMRLLVTGPDFALGKNREGDIATLSKLGGEMGFEVTCVEPVQMGEQPISSTAIRDALAEGDVAKARSLLGRPFELKGRVVVGDKRGHLLGFPTANLDIEEDRALPADGVYATTVYVGGVPRPSVTYFGPRPTFKGLKHSKEVYILDFDGDLYGQDLTIELVARLRGDISFASADELIDQMHEDVSKAREALAKA